MNQVDQEFAAWRGTTNLPVNLFVKNFFIPQSAVPSLEIRRDREIPAERTRAARARYMYLAVPAGGALGVEIYEHRSRDAAHDDLLALLREFESPLSPSREDRLGDVAFASQSADVVVFARANLVLKVRRAERERVAVLDAGTAIDALITREAPAETPSLIHSVIRLPDGGLMIQPREFFGGRETMKVFGTGVIYADEKGNIIYRPASPSDQPRVLIVHETGATTVIDLRTE